MAHAYCTDCSARVTVVDGRCLLDHRIDPSTISEGSGRRSRARGPRQPKRRPTEPATPTTPNDPIDPTPTDSVAERLDRIELDIRPSTAPSTRSPSPVGHQSEEHDLQHASGVTTLEHPRLPSTHRPRHVLAPTNDLIDQMWSASPETDSIDGWTLQELDTDGSAVARWVFLGTVLTVGLALLVASAWFFTGRGDATVESTLAHIKTASAVLSEALVQTDPVIADFSDGDLDDREAAAAASTALDGGARTLFGHASNLPTTDEWAELRSTTVSLSDRSIATARLLSRTTSYVATIEVMFNRPAYPLTAEDTEIGDVAEMTAVWVSRFIATSSSLPEVNALDEHRREVDALAARLPTWQSTYLDALRAGDVEAAGAAVGDLEDAILALEADLSEGERSIAEELADQQSALLSDLGA